jgi:hypothetical protein
MLPQYGSDELRLNGQNPPPRNLGKRLRSDEELPAPPAGALGFTRESRIFPGAASPIHVPRTGLRADDPKFPIHHVPDPSRTQIPLSTPEGRPGRPHLNPTGWWPTSTPALPITRVALRGTA